jgi:hypothetical protein
MKKGGAEEATLATGNNGCLDINQALWRMDIVK